MNIGKIAEFFKIPASTLRYWEEAGLLSPEKNRENDYRAYTVDDLMTISDILFYKSLGLPLGQIRDMERTPVSEQRRLLEEKMGSLVRQKAQIDRQLQRIQYHLSAMEMLRQLAQSPLRETDIDTDCIVSFQLMEIDKLRQYIDQPYRYARVQHSDAPEREQRGLTIPLSQALTLPPEQILWKKTGSRYLTGLLREEITEGFPNNLPALLSQAQARYKTGYIISRFLLCAEENGRRYDYYRTYLEIL